ncbi:MAG: inorganic pyrophosphatase [Bacilli bacterium]|nr:inorganic pyrophosphatase [Bacilli bacterium]
MTNATINNPYLDTLKTLLGKEVLVIVDRPYGSVHPKHPNIHYSVNYGYIELMKAPDGEYQDAYILGINEPLESYKGIVIAIIHRTNDVEDKLVVAPKGIPFTDDEILSSVNFQEQYFESVIVR